MAAKRKSRNGSATHDGGGAPAYDRSWYALGLASEFELGKVIGKPFLGGRVIIFRGEDGKAAVMSAYCAHLGADLSLGRVIGNDIQCAFHHWQYGQDGRCTHIPASPKIPKAARVVSFPTAEKWGLVWAFNGPQPLFALPEFRSYSEAQLHYRTAPAFDLPVEPWVPFTNSMDFQHLRELHGLKIDFQPDDIRMGRYGFEYDVSFEDPKMGVFDQEIRVTGTNTISLTGKLNGMPVLSMATGSPMDGGRTKGWSVTATPKASGEEPAAIEQRLAMGEAFFRRLIEEDEPIMSSIRFRKGVLIDADRALAKFLQYRKRFPKAQPLLVGA
jgi:phenylpropionate dioxygenase-like ring-hydroxylating dioxygenase large terminal subunit